MEPWEVAARERIRDTLARYNWAGDAFRLDELAQTFREDGELEIRGLEPLKGRAAIIDFLGGGTPGGQRGRTGTEGTEGDEARRAARKEAAAETGAVRIVRHNVTNVRFLDVTPERARVSSYFTVLTEIGLDHYGRYRDLFVREGDEWLIGHRFVSTDWRSPQSSMARAVPIR